jgi:tetratricopeptide (TPR) repeat protein
MAAENFSDVGEKESWLESISYNLIEVGDLEMVLELAKKLNYPSSWNVSTYSGIIEALVIPRDLDRALELIQEIPENCKAESIKMLTSKISKLEDLDKALELIEKYLFCLDNIPGSDNERLIEYLERRFGIDWVKTAKIEKIDFYTRRVSVGKNNLSLKLISGRDGYLRIKIDDGRTYKCIASYENKKSNIYDGIINNVEKMDALRELSVKMGELGDLDRALNLIEKTDNSSKLDAFRELSVKMAELGKFDRALEVAEKINSDDDKAVALIQIALFMAKLGEKDKASNIAYTILEMIEKTGRDDVNYILKIIAFIMVELGEFNKALEVASKIKDNSNRNDTFYNIYQILVKIGSLDMAIEAIAKNEDINKKIDSVTEISHALEHSNNKSRAIEILNKALLVVEEKEDDRFKIDSLIKVSHAFTQLDERSKAIEVVNMALQVAEKEENDKIKIDTLIEVTHAFTQLDEKTKAMEISEKMLKILKSMKFMTSPFNLVETMNRIKKVNEAHVMDKFQDQAFSVFISEFAKIQSRKLFFEELSADSYFIASIDQGQTLWKTYETILEVDNWWAAK